MKKGKLKAKALPDTLDDAIDTGLINEEEAGIIRKSIRLSDEIIAVDDFAANMPEKQGGIWQSQEQAAGSI